MKWKNDIAVKQIKLSFRDNEVLSIIYQILNSKVELYLWCIIFWPLANGYILNIEIFLTDIMIRQRPWWYMSFAYISYNLPIV